MNFRTKTTGFLFILALLLSTTTAFAQTTSGSIAGNVNDSQQASVNGATVTISDVSRGFSQTATSDKEGRFVFPSLSPGTYKLTIEAKGFKKLERTGMLLVANDKLALGDLVLEVGGANETVTITAEATLVQSQSAERSTAIQGEIVRSIAVNGRGFTPLASIAPGVVNTSNNAAADGITSIAANGLRTSANNLTLDGVSIVDTGNNGSLLSLNLDAISEFKVLTSNYQAEYGRSAGAQISAVTRGGTKDFHGSFYTFRRHDGMNANTWINNRDKAVVNGVTVLNKPRLDQRDIGYTIGGPVYIPKVFNKDKQKLFFFWNQEFQKRLVPPASPNRVSVPTALERAGDFSKSVDNSGNAFPYIGDPNLKDAAGARLPCTAANTTGCFQDGGVLGKIPANRLYGLGLNILKIYPLPNVAQGSGFNYQTEALTANPQRQDLVRIDYNLSSAWRVTGRYVNIKNDNVQPYGSFVLVSNLPDYPVVVPQPRNTYAFTVTGSLNPTTILEATVGGSHNSIDINPANAKFNKAGLGLTGIPVLYPGAVQIDSPPRFCFGGTCGTNGRVTNGPNIGSNNAPFTNFNTNRDTSVSLSKIWGQHTIKTGVFWQNSFKPQSSFANNNGLYDFGNDANNSLDTGFAFANAALGVYRSFQQASGYFIGKYRYNNLEWFAQDNWKVTSKLTFDYGMRFYWIQPQYDEDLQTANFLPNRYSAGDAPRLYRPICINGASTCASGLNRRAVDPILLVPGFVPTAANTSDGAYVARHVPNTGKLLNGIFQAGAGIEKGLYRNRGIHFAPRFGFAYDVMGNQSLVVRGGGGMFYDRPQGNTVFDLLRNPPTSLEPTLFFGQIQDIGKGPVVLGAPGLVAFDRVGKVPTSYAYNLGIQKKLPFDSVLDVSYVGTLAQHQIQLRNINAPNYGAAFQASGQDPARYAGGVIPAIEPGLAQVYIDAGLKFSGANALPIDLLRPYLGFGDIQYHEPASSSNYHSLQTSLNRRFTKGLLAGVNYTWSKALGTQANDRPSISGFGAPNNFNQRRVNYAPQDFDRRHNFNINWVYDFPKATSNSLLGYLVNNWEISGIYRYQTGAPYNVGINITGLPYTLTGAQNIEGARLALVGNPGSGRSTDPYNQLNVAAFTVPKPGSLSLESGRNFLNRNPINSWDMSLSKEFRIKEDVKFQIRLDAFNALNHTQFDGINSTLNVSGLTGTATNIASPNVISTTNSNGSITINRAPLTGFGAVTSVRPPRNLQISARFQF